MHIHFTSPDRPKRFAKTLRKALDAAGHPMPLSRVQEAIGVMFGYRGWNDLIGQQGRGAASPEDAALSPSELEARYSAFARSLASALAIPLDAALKALQATRPTARQEKPDDNENWADVFDRMARSLTARASSITADAFKPGLEGFRIEFKSGRRGFTLQVADDGARVRFLQTGAGVSQSGSGQFGIELHRAGLTNASPKEAVTASTIGAPDQLLLDTLSRLSPRALSLLRASPAFSQRGYDVAMMIPEHFPYRELVALHPMLGCEVETFAQLDLLKDPDDDGQRARARLLFSPEKEISEAELQATSIFKNTMTKVFLRGEMDDADDGVEIGENIAQYDGLDMTVLRPRALRAGFRLTGFMKEQFAAYHDIVQAFVDDQWPGTKLDEFEVQYAAEAMGRLFFVGGTGLQASHIAFLSLGTHRLWPKTPEQLAAATAFIDAWSGIFGPEQQITPAGFYRELKVRFGGDWKALHAAADATGYGPMLNVVLHKVAYHISDKLKLEDGYDCLHPSVLIPFIPGDRGLVTLAESVMRWNEAMKVESTASVDEETEANFVALMRSDVLPPQMRADSAIALLNKLQIEWGPDGGSPSLAQPSA